jgi:hypothetical protein
MADTSKKAASQEVVVSRFSDIKTLIEELEPDVTAFGVKEILLPVRECVRVCRASRISRKSFALPYKRQRMQGSSPSV